MNDKTKQTVVHRRLCAITARLKAAVKSVQAASGDALAFSHSVPSIDCALAVKDLEDLASDIASVSDLFHENIPNTALTMAFIAQEVSRSFSIPRGEFITNHRVKTSAGDALKATVYLISNNFPHYSIARICNFVGKKDRKTVNYALAKAEQFIKSDLEFSAKITAIQHQIQALA